MTAKHTPRPLTYAEYALVPSDGRIWELIDGDFHVNPAPVTFHQTVSRRLQFRLMEQLEEPGHAYVFNAPTDVILAHTSTVQPDLMVVGAAKKTLISQRGIEGPPDVVVEILSPSSKSYDEVLKRSLYERMGVPEYWLVDPDEKTVEVLVLQGNAYVRQALFMADDTLVSAAFSGRIRIPMAPIFAPL